MNDNHLTKEQIAVLRHKDTEPAFSGALLEEKADGSYLCAGCGNKLFESNAKFDSHCGWPSFDQVIKNSVEERSDSSHGMERIEVVCRNCKGHLGHLFPDGPRDTTGMRYCINSLSLDFIDKSGNKKSGSG